MIVHLPTLNRAMPTALAAQIADFYAARVADQELRAGDRLPTIRAVAERCEVPRATVAEAYRLLADRGLVESVVGRGTTVRVGQALTRGPALGPHGPYAAAALRQLRDMPTAPPLPEGVPLVANLAELAPSGDEVPVAELRAAMDKVLRRGGDLLGYGHSSRGLLELRALVAQRWQDGASQLQACDVLVTAGAQQALDLALRTFCGPGDEVVITTPSYHQMSGLLRAHGLRAVAVPFSSAGLDLESLAAALCRPTVRMLYLMPTFHNPTGCTIPLAQRLELAALLAKTTVPVVEDEFQAALRFRGEALPSLRALDRRGLTVTVATASKELFPALRLGWVMGSETLLAPMAAVKQFMDLETSALMQAALVEFVRAGCLDRHLEALRSDLCLRHTALQEQCRAQLPAGCGVTDPDGGFVAWLQMPQAGQGDALAETALSRGVRVLPGRAFEVNGAPSRGVRLSLTRAEPSAIRAGVAVLSECARQLLQAQPSPRPFL